MFDIYLNLINYNIIWIIETKTVEFCILIFISEDKNMKKLCSKCARCTHAS